MARTGPGGSVYRKIQCGDMRHHRQGQGLGMKIEHRFDIPRAYMPSTRAMVSLSHSVLSQLQTN